MTLRGSRPFQQGVSKSLPLAGETSKAENDPRNTVGGQLTRLTQEDQDKADEEKQRDAMHDLVQTWLDRLQLISVITTFFASTEAGLLGMAIPLRTDTKGLSTIGQVANIGLMSALVMHLSAAIISFLAAFFLIRYKLEVAEKEEIEAEKQLVESPTSISLNDPEKTRGFPTFPYVDDLLRADGHVRAKSAPPGGQIIWSTNPHLVPVGPFQRQPPTELLARSHSLCIFLSFLGFLLALIGVISFSWDRLPLGASVFSSASVAFCLIAGVLILIVPSTKTSHIYYRKKSH